jgi:hypothetical protein
MSTPARSAADDYQVFISHAVEDKEVAQAICAALEGQGIRCWIAPRDILPGKDWAEAITDATDSCRGMVLVFSQHSNTSVHVRREVERAVASGGFLIPFRIADVPMSKALAYFLHSCQWLDALTPPVEKHVAQLVGTIRTLLAKEPQAANHRPPAPLGHAAPSASQGLLPWLAIATGTVAAVAALLLLGVGIWHWSTAGERDPSGVTTRAPVA